MSSILLVRLTMLVTPQHNLNCGGSVQKIAAFSSTFLTLKKKKKKNGINASGSTEVIIMQSLVDVDFHSSQENFAFQVLTSASWLAGPTITSITDMIFCGSQEDSVKRSLKFSCLLFMLVVVVVCVCVCFFLFSPVTFLCSPAWFL